METVKPENREENYSKLHVGVHPGLASQLSHPKSGFERAAPVVSLGSFYRRDKVFTGRESWLLHIVRKI